jgi:AraC-like DNA-binding protein
LALAEELSQCRELSTLLRRAVELGQERLGLEMIGLFLNDPTRHVLRGTWGTNAHGELVDECNVEREYGEHEREAYRRLDAGVGRWLSLGELRPAGNGASARKLRDGWQTLTPVRSLRAPVGMLYHGPVAGKTRPDVAEQERIAVFASLLGILIEDRLDPVHWPALPKPGIRDGALIREAITLLNEDPTISVKSLATRLSVSSARLARAFRNELSTSLVQYRNRLRLEKFFGLMNNRGRNFRDAAEDAGFGSYAQFHRIFRQHLGRPPSQYLLSARAQARSGS